jgi:sirohydrochlorin ferrochelatase
MAFQALKGSGGRTPQVPLGLMEPQTDAERQELERHAELILKAMINAAKADGQIDPSEARRIVGKLQEVGMDAETQQYVMAEMKKPMETQTSPAAQGGRSLRRRSTGFAGDRVDTPAEQISGSAGRWLGLSRRWPRIGAWSTFSPSEEL